MDLIQHHMAETLQVLWIMNQCLQQVTCCYIDYGCLPVPPSTANPEPCKVTKASVCLLRDAICKSLGGEPPWLCHHYATRVAKLKALAGKAQWHQRGLARTSSCINNHNTTLLNQLHQLAPQRGHGQRSTSSDTSVSIFKGRWPCIWCRETRGWKIFFALNECTDCDGWRRWYAIVQWLRGWRLWCLKLCIWQRTQRWLMWWLHLQQTFGHVWSGWQR
mmetsp:Transcript_109800/g.218069  ORF Transcript_109800/g.218069 Transcript_109800/m.218069 type:complete len:218 (-) Transcript_109800:369-1022(-)